MFDIILCYKETFKLLKKTNGGGGVKYQARRPFQKPLRGITSQCIYGFKSSHSPSEVGFGTIVVRTSKTSESGYRKKHFFFVLKREKDTVLWKFTGKQEE